MKHSIPGFANAAYFTAHEIADTQQITPFPKRKPPLTQKDVLLLIRQLSLFRKTVQKAPLVSLNRNLPPGAFEQQIEKTKNVMRPQTTSIVRHSSRQIGLNDMQGLGNAGCSNEVR